MTRIVPRSLNADQAAQFNARGGQGPTGVGKPNDGAGKPPGPRPVPGGFPEEPGSNIGQPVMFNLYDPNAGAPEGAGRIGIKWFRPPSDKRTAQEIIDANPLLKGLDNKNGVRDMLRERVGDFENDADAAFRAEQLLKHIECFDAEGKRLLGKDVGNGRIDGYDQFGQITPNTEIDRLMNFCRDGFSALKARLGGNDLEPGRLGFREEAEKIGIEWEPPEGDERSAADIIQESDLLRNLGNQSGLRDRLKDLVGDFETDPAAAYRAAQLLEHIDRFNADGTVSKDVDAGNGRIDGFTAEGEAATNTEAARLLAFGQQGPAALKGKLDTGTSAIRESFARKQAEALGIKWKRPAEDTRDAQKILEDNPLLKNLGNQSKVKDMLKQRVGDFETDADAAFRAAQLLTHIERFDAKGDALLDSNVGNGTIDGFTNDETARTGTEADRLTMFGVWGFARLKGDMAAKPLEEKTPLQKQAEAAGIEWAQPPGEKKSAQEIIDASPLLQHVADDPYLADGLKEKVGDFTTDADAAYRAVQVLEHIERHDSKGMPFGGETVGNGKIDGWLDDDMVSTRANSEAERLEAFLKAGYPSLSKLKPTSELQSYKDYLSKNPDADEMSKVIARYGAVLEDHYDWITQHFNRGELTAEDLKKYIEEKPDLDNEVIEALNFWAQPGGFAQLDRAANLLKLQPDDLICKKDISTWMQQQAPTKAEQAVQFLSEVTEASAVSNVDTSNFSADILTNPGNYSAEEKAAALLELATARQLIVLGQAAKVWPDGKGPISYHSKTHPNPEKTLADIDKQIAILTKDKVATEFLAWRGAELRDALLAKSPMLKAALQATYNSEIKTGKLLDKLWVENTKDGKVDQLQALSQFRSIATSLQQSLGIEGDDDIKAAVMGSSHIDEIKAYYEQELVSGKRLEDLKKTLDNKEDAVSLYGLELVAYTSLLDDDYTKKFTADQAKNLQQFLEDEALENATFADLELAYGDPKTGKLDEERMMAMLEGLAQSNPEFFMNPDGTTVTPEAVFRAVRGLWDIPRQATKTLKEIKKEWLNSKLLSAYDKGILHCVSGLILGGVTIGTAIRKGQSMTEKDKAAVAISSIMSTCVMAEGGLKLYKDYLKNVVDKYPASNIAARFRHMDDAAIKAYIAKFDVPENIAKMFGGAGNIVLGVFGMLDGTKSLKEGGSELLAGLTLTASSASLLSGSASVVEAIAALAGWPIKSWAAAVAGAFGTVAAIAGVAAFIIGYIISSVKEGRAYADFGKLLGSYLTKYGIDGNESGTYDDIKVEEYFPEKEASSS